MNITMSQAESELCADFERCENIISVMSTYRQETFIPIICMMVEEWAKAHGEDVCKLIDITAELIHDVNTVCGPY